MPNNKPLEADYMQLINNQPEWAYYNDKGKLEKIDYVKLANIITDKHPLLIVPFGDDLNYYMYNGINWEPIKKNTALERAKHYAFEYLKRANAYNVKRMEDVAKTVLAQEYKQNNPFLNQYTDRVAFSNGTYMLTTGELVPNKSEDYLINGHELKANTGQASPNIEEWGAYLFGDSWQFIKELLGYIFIPEQQTFNTITILLDEEGGSGKSYFFDKIVRPLIGIQNIADKDIDTLTGSNGKSNRFGTYALVNKLANIHLDIPNSRIDMPDVLKTISGGDTSEVEGKNTNAISVKLYSKLVFASNNKPRLAISSALLQRMYIVPIVAPKVRNNPQEMDIRASMWDEDKAVEELGGFAIECIKAFEQAKQKGVLSINEEVRAATKKWADSQDLITSFLGDVQEDVDESYTGGISKQVAYARFQDWLRDNNINSKINKRSFGTLLEQKGFQAIKTRIHPEGDTPNNVWSWSRLALKKYFD